MNRIQQRWAEDIAQALAVTAGFRFESVDFLCGLNPRYVGLHGFEWTADGRAYKSTAHCVPRAHASDGRTAIVLPEPEPWWVIVHELGHVLDERQDWRWRVPPCSEYARVNRAEAFAEAFLTWVIGPTRAPVWSARWASVVRWEPNADAIFMESLNR